MGLCASMFMLFPVCFQSEREGLARLVGEVRGEGQERERQLRTQWEEEKTELKQELYTLSVKVQL